MPTRQPLVASAKFWERLCGVVVFLVLALIPCLSPLRVPDHVIKALREGLSHRASGSHIYAAAHWLYFTQIDTFLDFGYAPLALKEGAFTILVTFLTFCWFVRLLAQARTDKRWGLGDFDWKFYGPLVALLLWSAVSLFYTPTFYYSLVTYALMAAGLLWFVVVYQMPKSERLVRHWFNAVLLAGGVVAFIAFLQDVDKGRRITGLLFPNIEQIAQQGDVTLLRLRMGSLIGHNIGVASLVSFSWFILLARLFQPTGWTKKLGWATLMVLMAYVIIATQTRGVWIVLGVLTPLHLFWLMRLRGWDFKPVLAMILTILIIVWAQMIESPHNPFWSPESPLRRRFSHFSPSYLVTETRLRIAVCSLPLITERLPPNGWRVLSGYGLGSFQYVFPPAQAEYFKNHPDTVLAPTPHRTVQAHSDWLQLLVELGLPGLIIVLMGLCAALRRGWRGWQRLRGPLIRLEMTAALMPVVGAMIHAIADFCPAHVVSTAANVLFFLAVWSSSGQIEQTAQIPSAIAGAPQRPHARPYPPLLRPVALAVVIAAMLAASTWFYMFLQASTYESLGTGMRVWFGMYANDPKVSAEDKQEVLARAYQFLKRGYAIAPLDCQIMFRLGEVATFQGILEADNALAARSSSDPRQRGVESFHRSRADVLLEIAKSWLTDCQREVRYHEVFHYLGLIHEKLYQLYRRPQDQQEAKKDFRLAKDYSPCFGRSLFHLFLMLKEDRPPDHEEARKVLGQLAFYDPALFERQFVRPVTEACWRYDYQRALEVIDDVLGADPRRSDLWTTKIELLAFTGKGEDALALIDDFRAAFPECTTESLLHYRIEATVAARRYNEALNLVNAGMSSPAHEVQQPRYYRCIRSAVLEKLGRGEALKEWLEIDTIGESDPEMLSIAAVVYLFLLHEPDRAYPYLARYCSRADAKPGPLFRIAAEMCLKRGEKEQALKFVAIALAADVNDRPARELQRTLKP